jgi:hypothetical protein
VYRNKKILLFAAAAVFALIAGRTPGARSGSCSGIRTLTPSGEVLSCPAETKPALQPSSVSPPVEKRKETDR